MKLAAACLLLATALRPASSAFVAVSPSQSSSNSCSHCQAQAQPLVRLEMAENSSRSSGSRRQVLQQAASALTLATVNSLLLTAAPVLAERPTYLTEPTDEFKESERQRAEFRKQQIVVKQKFVVVLDRLNNESKTEDQLEGDLKELTSLVISTGGLPLGITKEDVVKQVRTKKAKGFWPTNVEIAYQALVNEIRYQQSPNTEKDTMNPL